MKKTILPFLVVLLISTSTLFAQTLMDYVLEVRGDTLVVKDFVDLSQSSTLNQVITLDVSAPAGRVYMLKANGFYPLSTNLTTPTDRAVVIVGADNTRLVASNDAASAPPIICGSTIEGAGSNTGGINFQHDLTVKNACIMPAAPDATLGWAFFGAASPSRTLTLDNCLFEHTRWVIVQSNDEVETSIYINDCYFVNLSGQACRRNGGAYDNVNHNTATMFVENSTHIMAQGMMYKFRNYPVGQAFFNHNTFVNCSGNVFETLGYQSNMVITNNIFVNTNVQPYFAGLDAGETDADNLPMGIVNVRPLPADMPQLDRKILVEANSVYWDSRLDDMHTTLNADPASGSTAWVSQMITMNTRTKGMFDDNATYPYLTEGVWYNELPNFTDPKDLLTAQVDVLKQWSVQTVIEGSTNVMPDWRLVSTGTDNYVYADWPIQVDLSYSNTTLLTGATGGFPVGDLNWFPTKKAQWEAQKDAEHTAINAALAAGTSTLDVEALGGLPVQYNLMQNYPNPFNPSTTINFSIPKSGNVTLKVYNALGEEVATLLNEFKTAQSYNVSFNASNLASGVYIYTLNCGNYSFSKKMVLMK